MNKKMILELNRTINMLMAHPDNEPNSEFADRIDSLIELKHQFYLNGVVPMLPKMTGNEFQDERIDDKLLQKGKDCYCVNNVYRHFLNLIEFGNQAQLICVWHRFNVLYTLLPIVRINYYKT